MKELFELIKNRSLFKWNQLPPTILIIGVLYFTFFNTFSFDIDEKVYGKVIFRACYEGTQNQTTFKLREKNRFEIHATGVFFYDTYFKGHYNRHGDTVDLKYEGAIHRAIGERVFMNNRDSVMEVIKRSGDSTGRPLRFYYGYCKGLN